MPAASPGIHAYSLGGAVAVDAGSGTRGSAAVGGGIALNSIGGSTSASVDSASQVWAGGIVTVSATGAATIDSYTLAGAVSVTGGTSSVSISIGLALAQNTISTATTAYLDQRRSCRLPRSP